MAETSPKAQQGLTKQEWLARKTGRAKDQKVCTNCGYVGREHQRLDGLRFLLLVLLLLFFFVPGILYAIFLWRANGMCPKCMKRTMIPIDTPKGRELLAAAAVSKTVPAQ